MSFEPALSWLGEREYERERPRGREDLVELNCADDVSMLREGLEGMRLRLKSSRASWSNSLVRELYWGG